MLIPFLPLPASLPPSPPRLSPSLPSPSPCHQRGSRHVLDSHNPSPLCRSVPLPQAPTQPGPGPFPVSLHCSRCAVCAVLLPDPPGHCHPSTGRATSPQALIKGRRSAEAANRCYHCSRVLIDFNYTRIRFLVLLSRCRRLYRTVDNVYPLDLFYWLVCLLFFLVFFRDRLEWGEGENFPVFCR